MEINEVIKEIELILKEFVIFWEELKSKNSFIKNINKTGFRITKQYISIFQRITKIINQRVHVNFLYIFNEFVRTIDFGYDEFHKLYKEKLNKDMAKRFSLIKIEDSLINVENMPILFLLSAQKKLIGKINFVSFQARDSFLYPNHELYRKNIDMILLPG